MRWWVESARAIVAPHFAFLEERFQWSLTATDDRSNWETTVTYSRDSAAVIVRYSVDFSRAEVELIRLTNGKMPPVPIFVHPDTRLDRYDLDNVLVLRAPSMLEALRKTTGLEREMLDQTLALEASALEQYASGFLRLDMGLFDELDKVVKSRIGDTPQRATVWVPHGTPEDVTAETVARIRQTDSQVPVDVREYRRPARGTPQRRWPWRRIGRRSG